jgi:hypothetical protein
MKIKNRPVGWRRLRNGETIHKGDWFLSKDEEKWEAGWTTRLHATHMCKIKPEDGAWYFRKVKGTK